MDQYSLSGCSPSRSSSGSRLVPCRAAAIARRLGCEVPPASVPLWMAILLLCVVYGAIAGPLGAMQSAAHSALTGQPNQWGHHGGGVWPAIFFAVFFWLIYVNVPGFHHWADQAWIQINAVFRSLIDAFI